MIAAGSAGMLPLAAIATCLDVTRTEGCAHASDEGSVAGERRRLSRREIVMANKIGTWLALAFWALGFSGCGGSQAVAPAASTANEVKEKANSDAAASGPRNSVSKHGSGSVALLLGVGGGTLELDEGPRVVIPAGAVQSGQEYVLKIAAKTTAFSNKESERPLGPTFSFAPGLDAPDGLPCEVSFPLASVPAGWGEPSIAYEVGEDEAISYGEDSQRTKWQYERAKTESGRVVARLNDLQGLRMQFVLTNLEAQ
jgi:hypothetical protein